MNLYTWKKDTHAEHLAAIEATSNHQNRIFSVNKNLVSWAPVLLQCALYQSPLRFSDAFSETRETCFFCSVLLNVPNTVMCATIEIRGAHRLTDTLCGKHSVFPVSCNVPISAVFSFGVLVHLQRWLKQSFFFVLCPMRKRQSACCCGFL